MLFCRPPFINQQAISYGSIFLLELRHWELGNISPIQQIDSSIVIVASLPNLLFLMHNFEITLPLNIQNIPIQIQIWICSMQENFLGHLIVRILLLHQNFILLLLFPKLDKVERGSMWPEPRLLLGTSSMTGEAFSRYPPSLQVCHTDTPMQMLDAIRCKVLHSWMLLPHPAAHRWCSNALTTSPDQQS